MVVAFEFLLEFDTDGGGDFSLGEVGQRGVVSPDAPPFFCTLGSLETASDTPPAGNCGAFAADSALCIAAAEGCVEGGLERGCCRLSLRIGEVLRDVRGLAPADDVVVGTRLLDVCFCNGGAVVTLLLEEEFAVAPLTVAVSAAWPLPWASDSALFISGEYYHLSRGFRRGTRPSIHGRWGGLGGEM